MQNVSREAEDYQDFHVLWTAAQLKASLAALFKSSKTEMLHTRIFRRW